MLRVSSELARTASFGVPPHPRGPGWINPIRGSQGRFGTIFGIWGFNRIASTVGRTTSPTLEESNVKCPRPYSGHRVRWLSGLADQRPIPRTGYLGTGKVAFGPTAWVTS